jgi:signal transduction histidine kinase
LGRRWHTTTFRLLCAYGVIFALSMVLLLGYIGWVVTGEMESETDFVMNWQFIYFNSIPDNELAGAIARRLEHEHMHTNYYGLFTADGRHVIGDVLRLPSQLPVDQGGMTFKHTLSVAGDEQAPVVRAMARRRKDGEILLVAQDLTHILRIRGAIIKALIGGGIFCLVAGAAVGLAFGMRQMRRVKAIRRVTLQIAQGDLHQRLPVGGRDELDMLSHLVNRMLDEVERLMTDVKGACDGIAHDLRTPLAHVRTLLARMAERTDALDDEALSNMLARARSDTERLLDRFRAMLRISEIGALQRRGGFAEVQLETLVSEIGELYEPLAESKSIEWVVRATRVPAIHGDRTLLFEMFSNLLDNAIKFTPTGGTVRMELTATPYGPRLDIVDNGPGIPSSERGAVLQLFYRSEQTRHIAGSGLGLSIVSAVIRVHDFTMSIGDAEPGTRVTIECWPKTLA